MLIHQKLKINIVHLNKVWNFNFQQLDEDHVSYENNIYISINIPLDWDSEETGVSPSTTVKLWRSVRILIPIDSCINMLMHLAYLDKHAARL